MAYYIAMDAGGTKAETVLFDETGHILLRDISRGCTAMDIGADETVRRVTQTLHRVGAHIPGGVPDYAFCGVSSVIYYKKKLTDRLDAAMAGWPVHWEDDGPGMISSMLDQRDGGCMVCGTGCSLFLRARGELYHVGGWGYLVDDAGSGYSIGRAVLNAAFRERDGRGESTRLTELVERQLGFNVLGAVPMIYRGGKRTVASFAPLAFEAADMGDRQALAIVDNACRELRLLISTCASHLKKAPYLASLLGSLWKAPRLLEGVRDLLSPDYRLLRPDLPPVFGAAVAAAELARVSCGEAFHDRFAESYTTFTKKAEA